MLELHNALSKIVGISAIDPAQPIGVSNREWVIFMNISLIKVLEG
jgi:hypothetical protein